MLDKAFKTAIALLIAAYTWIGNLVYQKVDSAADKIEVARVTKDMWDAIGRTTASQQILATSLAVLKSDFSAHEAADSIERSIEVDHESRLRTLESRVRPPQ